MNINELMDCLLMQVASVAETLNMVQKIDDCDESIKKILNNQVGMLVFCQNEIEQITKVLNLLQEKDEMEIYVLNKNK